MSEPAIDDATSPPAPKPIDVLELRAWARAYLRSIGEFDGIPEAVDPLQAFAVASGLVDEIGQDAVQKILADVFALFRGEGEP
jgi:hypothetical protein